LGVAYPAFAVSFISLLSFGFYAVTHRVFLVPIALFSTGLTLPIVALAATQMGRYIRDYSHLYRGKRDIREWLDFKRRNPNIFTDKSFDQRGAQPGFDRQRTEEPRYELSVNDRADCIVVCHRVLEKQRIRLILARTCIAC
jgi:hypothetical protein